MGNSSESKLNRRDVLQAGLQTGIAAAVISMPSPAPARKRIERTDVPRARTLGGISTSPVAFENFVLSRLAFGARPADAAEWQKLGPTDDRRLEAWLEAQLKPSTVPDIACDKRIADAKLTTLAKTPQQLWSDHGSVGMALKQELDEEARADVSEAEMKKTKREMRSVQREPAEDAQAATWIRAVYSERRLFEVMTSFWHNHFNVYAWDNKIAPAFVQFDRDVIRKNALGNFRVFLEDVAASPAMLMYLDNGFNQSGNPNENFARELFELHTLGAENYLGTIDRNSVPRKDGRPIGYVDGDVYEAARAFTGWRLDQGKKSKGTGGFEYFEPWHDRFQKIVLGQPVKEYQPPMKDGRDVLDLLAEHPGTARFICRKLCLRLVGDRPPESLVAKAARVFHDARKAADQIQRTVKAIVLSEEFKSSQGQKLTGPFESVVAFLRATQAEFQPTPAFLKNFDGTGRRLFSWRTPDGFPEAGERWLSTDVFFERWRLINRSLVGKLDGVTIDPDKIGAKSATPAEFLAKLERDVLRRPLAASSRQAIESFLSSNTVRPRGYQLAVAMAFVSPEMQRT